MLKSALTSVSILSIAFLLFFFTFRAPLANGALSTHIVISEVEIFGTTASDEFVELYNPTESDISLNGWRLARKTEAGNSSNLVASLSGTIKAHGYYLITPQTGYVGSASADKTYSVAGSVLATNNTVLLYSDAGITLVDKVGLGTATDKETAAITNPVNGTSTERKANNASTIDSMTSGIDALMGNGEDTDNNQNDFIIKLFPQPQNSLSGLEPLDPTPTETATPTPSETPTPSASLSPTPSDVPLTPTNTPTLVPSITPTNTITPTPTRSQFPVFPQMRVICTTKTISVRFMNLVMEFPYPLCTIVRI